MKTLIKIAIVIIIAIIVISSAYVAFFRDEEENGGNGNGETIDEEPPKIDTITGDMTINSGEKAKISATFSDNIEVTEAIIYYKTTGGNLLSGDILSGSYTIDIPADSNQDWYYYVVIDDAAGNGPVGRPSNDGSFFYTITILTNNGDNNSSEQKHIVFIEESTSTTCQYCPDAAEVLYKLYNPEDPDFYFISLVEDESSKAYDRVQNHYNRFANPQVYIDGGHGVIQSFIKDFEESLKQKIKNAATAREIPEIFISLEARWNETRRELTTNVDIENKDSFTYTGNLKVFITEIQSRWIDFNGDPFHYAFIDYSINQDITIKAGENNSYSKIWNASSAGFSNIYPENIQVFAVVFNSEKKQGYSKPPDAYPFDAYYADASIATKIKEGSLPPTIGIVVPKAQSRYFFGIKIMPTFKLNRTVLIGRSTIKASIEAEAGVERVEFYIDGKLVYNTTKEPYEYTFRKINQFKRFILKSKHTIEVKVIDKDNKIATDSLDIITHFL